MSDISNEKSNPWDSDLEAAFEDEATRSAVSEFLGEKIQPYITKIEQDSKPDRDASMLWEQFHDKPVETTLQVIKELYGEDKADSFAAILQGSDETITAEDVEKPTEGDTPAEAATKGVKFEDLPEEVQEFVRNSQVDKAKEMYYGEIDRIKADHADELPKDDEGNPKLNADLFHPFVVSADGDFDVAFEGFQKFIKEASGDTSGDDSTTTDPPPKTIDSNTRDASAKVPAEKQHQSFDDAMDDFLSDLKAPPPTVGAV